MKRLRNKSVTQLVAIAIIGAMAVSASAQDSRLGSVKFPNSGTEKVQGHFLRGLAALHSFWYEEALEAFRESTRIQPDFMMGHWGEAMAHNHPLWSEQDTVAGRQVVARMKESANLTPRERAYLGAVKQLYAEGNDKPARDTAYSAAMEKIYRDYPEDLDAAAFYSLSLLGRASLNEKGYRLQARAGAIALDVYQRNPNHPGAAHYIIHAFDDPDHAILALPAARRYAEIAPEAHHARHMPSHIFLQLGMWREAAASNESAWESSDAWMKRKNLSASVRDYHSLHWLLYVYLQQGRYRKAEELLNLMKDTMSGSTYENKLRPGYYENNYANMAAAYVFETERWGLGSKLFPESEPSNTTASAPAEIGGSHGGHGAKPAAIGAEGGLGSITVRASNRGRILPLFTRGYAFANSDSMEFEKSLTGLRSMAPESSPGREMIEIRQLEISAVAASRKKDHARAIELMERATGMEETLAPPSGPPALLKPSHELFGEILLRAGKAEAAAEQFKIALLRQPNRARSLIGAARAAVATGDRTGAAIAYHKLLEQWKQADEDIPELREARDFLKQAKN